MDKNVWKILGILFLLLTLVLIVLVLLVPYLKTKQAYDDCLDKDIPKEENTDLWAKFPGRLNTSTEHTIFIYNYSKDLKNATLQEGLTLDEATEYDNFKFGENQIYFDAKSNYTLQNKARKTNGKISTLNLGMFETFETLSNPPLYQKGVNSISYLLNKAFQKPEIFIKHIFTYKFYNSYIKDEDKVLQTILKDIDEEKARKILSNEEKYAKYSFKTIRGFYEWVKLLGNSNEIKQANWLIKTFNLTIDEIDSIFGQDKYLYKEYLDYNNQLAQKYKCKSNICGNEIIYAQLISGKELADFTNSTLNTICSLYNEINKDFYPFSQSPELFLFLEEYKNRTNEKDVSIITAKSLETLLDPNSKYSLLSSQNSATFLSLVQSNNETKLSKLYDISLKQSKYLCEYFYEFLPKLFLYQEFQYQDKNLTINSLSKTYSSITEKALEKSYYKLYSTNNLYNFLLSKYVWRSLHYKLLNLSMEYDDEDICPLIFQHALDDGRKVLQICSDPVTSFKTPYELSKWFEPYYCIKGKKSDCNMRIISYLKSIVYITEDEINSIYDLDNLGQFIEENAKSLSDAFNCSGECSNDYLVKIQFWKSSVSKNLPIGFNQADSLSQIFPEEYPYPLELYYYAKNMKLAENITEDIVDALISLSPKNDKGLLNEDNYEAFNAKMKLEKDHTLYIEKGLNLPIYTFIDILRKQLLFDDKINTEYENADKLLQGSEEDKNYIQFLSEGEYYENFKPGIKKTTGFNFGINLVTGEKNNKIEYDRYCIDTEEGKNMRKITRINDFPLLNIKKPEYNYLTKDYSYIDSPILNFQSLTGEKTFIDGFQYDDEEDVIYYYDKISSRPYKFTYSEEIDYGDQTCRKYNLDKNDITDNMNEKDDLNISQAFISHKLNKPFVVSLREFENENSLDEIEEGNFICVEPYSKMVLNSVINFVYSIYTRKYGFINSNIENEKLYPIFTYNRNFKVDIDSFNEIFSEINSSKSFNKAFIITLVILIIIFAIAACICFIKYCLGRRGRINLEELPKDKQSKLLEQSTESENKINDSKRETTS